MLGKVTCPRFLRPFLTKVKYIWVKILTSFRIFEYYRNLLSCFLMCKKINNLTGLWVVTKLFSTMSGISLIESQ